MVPASPGKDLDVPLHLLHVPKTGGTSLIEVLKPVEDHCELLRVEGHDARWETSAAASPEVESLVARCFESYVVALEAFCFV